MPKTSKVRLIDNFDDPQIINGIEIAKKMFTTIQNIFACSQSRKLIGYKKTKRKCPYWPF